MSTLTAMVTKKGVQLDALRKLLEERYGKDAVRVEMVTRPDSRAERLSTAESQVDEAKGTIEELKEELENWKENLPENLQSGQKADDLDSAISMLEELVDALDGLDWGVEFPGMFG